MAQFVVNGLVPTSWAGNGNAALIGSGTGAGVAQKEATLTIAANAIDSTVYAASLTNTAAITGLRSASVQFGGRWNPAYNCANIGLSFANGYVANLRRFSVGFAWTVQEATVSTGSALTAMSYLPGLGTVSGTYECYVDDTTAVALPGGATTGSATFTLNGDASTDHTLAGTIITTQLGISLPVGGRPVATYAYQFTGNITAAGDADGTGDWPASPWKYWIDSASGVIGTPVTGSLVLTAATGRTYTFNAFPTGITLECAVGQELTVAVSAQGTGDVTVA